MTTIPGVLPPLRRYRQIAAVLVRHGLGDVASTLGLRRRLPFARRYRPARDPAHAQTRSRRIRLALEELGPTFVKFGQTLSTRRDVLPLELIAELQHLQDDARPLMAGEAEASIAQELGRPVEEIFPEFDPTPVAAASIAQVHRARLADGTVVAVKVRRPGIRRVIDDDLAVLSHLAHLAERHLADAELYAPSQLVDEFARTIHRELDLTREGRMLQRFAANFPDNPTIRFPRVYWSATTAGVLTMEFMDAARLNDRAAWPPGTDASLIARRGADALLQQILMDGLFHADPHPGNIFILPGNTIVLLDFGIVGRLDTGTRDWLAELLEALGHQDAERSTDLLLGMAEPGQDVHLAHLHADVAELIDSYAQLPLGQLPVGEILGRVMDLVSTHRLRLPSDLMLLSKALMTIEAVGAQLDPGFRMLAHAAPFAARLAAGRRSPSAMAARAAIAGRKATTALQTFPSTFADLVRQLRTGRLSFQIQHRNVEALTHEVDRAGARVAGAIALAGAVAAGALLAGRVESPLVGAALPWAVLLLIVAALMVAFVLISRLRTPRR